jgi:hypothetical protein
MPLRRIITLLMLAATCQCSGNDSLPSKDSGSITIMLQNASDRLSKIDSVFLVFDRFDLRGAGVIKQVFYPDADNKIRIILPRGKYYININCLGIYNKEAFNRIASAKPRKNQKIFLRLQASALYHQGSASMPLEHFDPSHLAIFHYDKK